MGLFENIKMALEGVRSNKLRSFLTALGIIIGIASVIAILTIGHGLQASVSGAFDSFAKNQIRFNVQPKDSETSTQTSVWTPITSPMLDDIKEQFQGRIGALSVTLWGPEGTLSQEDKSAKISCIGGTEGMKTIQSLKLLAGRFITDDDDISQRPVVVLSDVALKHVYGKDFTDMLGKEVVVNAGGTFITAYLAGIYKYDQPNLGILGGGSTPQSGPPITTAYFPRHFLAVATGNLENLDETSNFTIAATSKEDVAPLRNDIIQYLNNQYFQDSDFEVSGQSADEALQEINNALSSVQLAIGGIAAISLLVGGIGVMNILLVSVMERTREIGIRKALGAPNKAIRRQFLVESMIICALGGIFGVILGGGLGYAATRLMGTPAGPTLFSIVLAVGFSMAIGIFFGSYPAGKAAKLDPIEALRYE